MNMTELINQEIDEMTAQMTAFIENANRQISAMEGGIQALKNLLQKVAEEPADDTFERSESED